MKSDEYELLDSGHGLKFERFGAHRVVRPAAQAVWDPQKPASFWNQADARFARTEGKGWEPADEHPFRMHFSFPFDEETGAPRQAASP